MVYDYKPKIQEYRRETGLRHYKYTLSVNEDIRGYDNE